MSGSPTSPSIKPAASYLPPLSTTQQTHARATNPVRQVALPLPVCLLSRPAPSNLPRTCTAQRTRASHTR
ncbi:hypothetical protein BC567DRAFT_223087 [Phyllosticta citribraziliensis]